MVSTVHNNYTKLMRWMRCRWEWCLPATKSINVELQKITLPWRPLLSYHGGADSHYRDMIRVPYHRQATHLWCSGDLFDTTIVWCSQGYVEERSIRWSIKNLCSTFVHRIINKRLPWRWNRSFYSIYMCIGAVFILCWAIWILLFTQAYMIYRFFTHLHEH